MFADGSLGVRRIWWLLQCSHLMVPLCIVVCPVGARLTAVCGAAQLLCCLRSSQFGALSFSAGTLIAAGVRRRGGGAACRSLYDIPAPPPPSGAEFQEAPKAPKKIVGLNELAPKAPEKNFDWPKIRKETGPNRLKGGSGSRAGGVGVVPPQPHPTPAQ